MQYQEFISDKEIAEFMLKEDYETVIVKIENQVAQNLFNAHNKCCKMKIKNLSDVWISICFAMEPQKEYEAFMRELEGFALEFSDIEYMAKSKKNYSQLLIQRNKQLKKIYEEFQ